MMKKVCTVHPPLLVLYCFFFIVSAFFLYAQNVDDAEGKLITGLSVSGLKRTKLSTVERSLNKFIGIEADKLDSNEVWAAILNTGILEPVSVEIESRADGEKILAVVVEEKWSLFPVPVFMIGSGGMTAGGAIFDANAFGLNDKFFLAGLYLSSGWLVTGGYMHAPPGGRIPGWNIMGIFSREERHDGNQRDRDLRIFDLDSISVWAGLNSHLLRDSDLLSASLNISYNQTILRNQNQAVNGPLEGLYVFGAGAGLSLERSSWDGYFLSQEEASFEYSFNVIQGGNHFHSVQFRGVWEKALVPGFRLSLRTGLVFEPDVPILFESSPYSAQVNILPGSFSAQNYAGVSAGLEKYLFKFSAGTFSVSAAYQLVYSHGSVLGNSLDHGVVGMFSFYLSRLAIPALGFGAAYNVKEDYLQGSFSIGMSF